jgi:pantothenate synthetase
VATAIEQNCSTWCSRTLAIFGQKDYRQLAVIHWCVILNMPIRSSVSEPCAPLMALALSRN